jgi:D-alanyl-D-alanine carboxypeptidase
VSVWRIEFLTRAREALKVAGALLLAAGVTAAPAVAKGIESSPKYAAVVVDTATGKVLYERNADARRYPASLTKMMTLYVLFEDIERGRFKLGSKLSVSPNAAAQAPSKLGLRAGQTIAVEDAIKALVTKSANDAATAIGENVSGSVPAFAKRMTRTARALGMSGTVFRNPSGLPDKGQYTTARDMMKLGVALQVRFPQYYPYFATKSFTYRGRKMGNHNRLLGSVEGVDGIKTGYINASGFNLVSSVRRDGRRIVAVVMGGASARTRDAHMRELIATYLPKAKRAKGFDDDLVAMVKSAPAGSDDPVKVAAAGGVLGKHPRPVPRPAYAGDEPETADPAIVTASVTPPPVPPPAPVQSPSLFAAAMMAQHPDAQDAADETEGGIAQGDAEDAATLAAFAADEPKKVRTLALTVPDDAPAPDAVRALPSSAHEAFADIGTGSTAHGGVPTPDQAALAAIIESRMRGITFDDTPAAPVSLAGLQVAAADAPEATPRTAPQIEPDPPAPKVPREAISGWMIQIGAVASERDAQRLLDKAKDKAGRVLAKADPVTETFAKGDQTFVRARFAGFDSQQAARKACAALKKNDIACFALRL